MTSSTPNNPLKRQRTELVDDFGADVTARQKKTFKLIKKAAAQHKISPSNPPSNPLSNPLSSSLSNPLSNPLFNPLSNLPSNYKQTATSKTKKPLSEKDQYMLLSKEDFNARIPRTQDVKFEPLDTGVFRPPEAMLPGPDLVGYLLLFINCC